MWLTFRRRLSHWPSTWRNGWASLAHSTLLNSNSEMQNLDGLYLHYYTFGFFFGSLEGKCLLMTYSADTNSLPAKPLRASHSLQTEMHLSAKPLWLHLPFGFSLFQTVRLGNWSHSSVSFGLCWFTWPTFS